MAGRRPRLAAVYAATLAPVFNHGTENDTTGAMDHCRIGRAGPEFVPMALTSNAPFQIPRP